MLISMSLPCFSAVPETVKELLTCITPTLNMGPHVSDSACSRNTQTANDSQNSPTVCLRGGTGDKAKQKSHKRKNKPKQMEQDVFACKFVSRLMLVSPARVQTPGSRRSVTHCWPDIYSEVWTVHKCHQSRFCCVWGGSKRSNASLNFKKIFMMKMNLKNRQTRSLVWLQGLANGCFLWMLPEITGFMNTTTPKDHKHPSTDGLQIRVPNHTRPRSSV